MYCMYMNLCFFHVPLLEFNITNGCHAEHFSLYIIFYLKEKHNVKKILFLTCVKFTLNIDVHNWMDGCYIVSQNVIFWERMPNLKETKLIENQSTCRLKKLTWIYSVILTSLQPQLYMLWFNFTFDLNFIFFFFLSMVMYKSRVMSLKQ